MNLSPREIGQRIYLIRDHRVILDTDLAVLYAIQTFNLNRAVKRNKDYFPGDFMFQLTSEEWESLKFMLGVSKKQGRGGRRTMPYAFTPQGVTMLAGILKARVPAKLTSQYSVYLE